MLKLTGFFLFWIGAIGLLICFPVLWFVGLVALGLLLLSSS